MSLPHADTSACYEYLQQSDFGFVHEILSIERIHNDRVSTKVGELYMDGVAEVEFVLKYGAIYLNESELDTILKRALAIYYRRLGGAALKLKGPEFWKFHISRMRELENSISWTKVVRAVVSEIIVEVKEPKVACHKLAQALKERWAVFVNS